MASTLASALASILASISWRRVLASIAISVGKSYSTTSCDQDSSKVMTDCGNAGTCQSQGQGMKMAGSSID